MPRICRLFGPVFSFPIRHRKLNAIGRFLRLTFQLIVVTGILMIVLQQIQVNKAYFPDGFDVEKLIESEPEKLSYCDLWNQKVGKKILCGKPFNSAWIPYLEWFNLSKQISKMTDADDARILSKEPIFVTAFSENRFEEAMKYVIPTMMSLSNKVFVYDLGLDENSITKLRKIPEISIVKFNFSAFPTHVHEVYDFRWKPIVFADMLKKYEAIFYADSDYYLSEKNSRRWPEVLENIRCQIDKNCSYYSSIILGRSGHSIFAATDKRMYDFLPIDPTASKAVEMGTAGFQMVFATKDVRSNILKWWILCALEEGCMNPKGTESRCNFTCESNRWTELAGCHRHDQSAISILLHNRNEYDEKKHLFDFVYDKFELE